MAELNDLISEINSEMKEATERPPEPEGLEDKGLDNSGTAKTVEYVKSMTISAQAERARSSLGAYQYKPEEKTQNSTSSAPKTGYSFSGGYSSQYQKQETVKDKVKKATNKMFAEAEKEIEHECRRKNAFEMINESNNDDYVFMTETERIKYRRNADLKITGIRLILNASKDICNELITSIKGEMTK